MAAITWRGVNVAGAEGGSKKGGTSDYPGVPSKDYIYPSASKVQPWLDKKAAIIRYPIAWERAQPDLNGPLLDTFTKAVDPMVDLVTATGAIINLDIHNYNERVLRDSADKVKINVDGKVTVDHYVDFVGKLAERYADNDLVSIGLMNEPHGFTWSNGDTKAAGYGKQIQKAVDKAREVGFEGWLTACTFDWGKVGQLDDELGDVLAAINDPLNKFVVEVHQYVDNGEQGDDASIINNDPDIYSKKLATGTEWTKRTGKPILLGEFGTPDTDLGVTVQTNLIKYLEDNGWWGYTAWSAGPWWSDNYFFLLDTRDKGEPKTVAPLKLGTDFPGGGTPPNPEPGPEPEPDELEERVDDLEDAVSSLDSRLTALETSQAALEARVAALETGSGGSGGGSGGDDVDARLDELEAKVDALDQRLDKIAEGAVG
jgi:endoglucanase